jgi:ABC-type antimicrobial peptide transport system permease subunit
MFKNYWKTAWRNLLRNKFFSIVNITGLTIGISAALVIGMVVYYDFSFDRFEQHHEQVYRVVSDMKFPDADFKNSGVPPPLVPAAKSSLTGVDLFVPFTMLSEPTVVLPMEGKEKPTVFRKRKSVLYADDGYFRLVPHQWIAGDVNQSLAKPFSVVLSESVARLYFPSIDPSTAIGRVVVYDDSIKATVTGIVKDINEHTDFTFKEFISYSTLPSSKFNVQQNWGGVSSNDQLFIRLQNAVLPDAVTKQIQSIFNAHLPEGSLPNTFSLQPLADVHFNSEYDNFDQRMGHRPTLYGLIVAAAVLLLLGCINFINLSTAQAVQRAKEIGVRKTMGGSRSQLIGQFLTETVLLTLAATIISLLLVPLVLRVFADFVPPELNTSMLADPVVILFVSLLVVFVGLSAGFYPAWILSGYKPVFVLKNQSALNGAVSRSVWVRKTLTVVQFVFAQALMIATLVVSSQIKYMLNKDLGFKKEGIVTIPTPFDLRDFTDSAHALVSLQNRKLLLQQISTVPGVADACLGAMPPSADGGNMQTMRYYDGKKTIETTVEIKEGNEAYMRLYHLQLLRGRALRDTDSTGAVVINESLARFLGFRNPADAVGKQMDKAESAVPIVGVVKDFFASSLRSSIKPLAFKHRPVSELQLHVALAASSNPGQWAQSLRVIEQQFKALYPEEDFNAKFVDDMVRKFYTTEQHTSTLLDWASGLAVVISCLGLLGLVMYTTNRRTKEIGVRKVLGATVFQILTLISKDFFKLLLVAFLIAVPLVWWGVHRWLQGFAYHTGVNPWLFAIAGLLMGVVAMVTLSYQTIRAASVNPVDSLKTE